MNKKQTAVGLRSGQLIETLQKIAENFAKWTDKEIPTTDNRRDIRNVGTW